MSTESTKATIHRFHDAVDAGNLDGTVATNHNPLLRLVALGGMYLFIGQAIHMWIVHTLIHKTPFIVAWQYIASGVQGLSAFEGGNRTALLGVLFHLVISFVIAGVFILSADRIPLLRRYIIPGALLYGIGVWIVMNKIVTPLSATPPIPDPTTRWLLEDIAEHLVFVGLPLGILVRRIISIKNRNIH